MRRHSAFASEGIWWFVACAVIAIAIAKLIGPLYALPVLIPVAFLIALFQDPVRQAPLRPRAVLAPCDGKVISVEKTRSGLLDRESLRVVIRVNPLGAYTIRAPVEGMIFDPRDNAREGSRMSGRGGMWLRTDEGDDVVVTFSKGGWLSTPQAFRRYGERVGHGHRCGFLRLARICEVYLPADAMPRVAVGDRVLATADILAELRRDRRKEEVTVAPEEQAV
ncbi:MAG: hypothetical protein AAF290_06465 [Pseudomonadota bacterium]